MLIRYLYKITEFDGTKNSSFPHTWMCWMINKNYISLIHLNTEKHVVTIYTVNPQKLNACDLLECKNQIIKVFDVSIPGYENIEIKIPSSLLRQFEVNHTEVITC